MQPSSERGRLLGIDHGNKVIGLAISDAIWLTVRPFEVLTRKDLATDFAHINAIVDRQRIVAIVVGLPELPEAGTAHNQADTVRRWVSRLAAQVSIPVYLWDEQYSTFEAEQMALESGERLTGRIDDRAAAVILQGFIDSHPPGTPLPEPVKNVKKL